MADFERRQLSDETWESVCQRCFSTVAVKATEENLLMAEQMHDCTLVPGDHAPNLR
jgi:hypothetical protein